MLNRDREAWIAGDNSHTEGKVMARVNGTVKWFSKEKGYGFLTQEGGPDVFVHHASIQGSGFKMLYEGERVEFDIIEEPKGLKAQNVVRLDPPQGGNGEGGGRAGAGAGGRGGERGGRGGGGGGGGGRGGDRDRGYDRGY